MTLTENELRTLEGLVSNNEEWGLLKKLFRYEIDSFWDVVRRTSIADDRQVTANHKLAVGVEASLGDLVKKIEDVVKESQSPREQVLPDITTQLLQ